MSEIATSEVNLAGTPFGVKETRGTYGALGDVHESSAETWEGMQWRLTEVEASTHLLASIEERFDAIIAEIISSHISLSKQVGRVERALGIAASPQPVIREISRSRLAQPTSPSSSPLRRDTLVSKSEAGSSSASITAAQRQARGSQTISATASANATTDAGGRASRSETYEEEEHGLARFRAGKPKQERGDAGGQAVVYGSPASTGPAEAVADVVREGLSYTTTKVSQLRGELSGTVLPTCDGLDDSLNSASDTILEAHVTRTLSPSVWNAAFFIGMNRTGWASSLAIVILLIINMAMQCTFLCIIRKITETEIFNPTQLEALAHWRLFVGQSVKYYDPLTKTALTQRVCAAGDQGSTLPVDLSDSKAQLVEDIKAYLPDGDDLWSQIVSGPSLTISKATAFRMSSAGSME